MIRSLQKNHRFIWAILSVVLPVGFIMALIARPLIPVDEPVKTSEIPQYGEVVVSEENEFFILNIRGDGRGEDHQLEIFVKQPITSPSLLIYSGTPGGAFDQKKDYLVGSLGPKDVYRFSLNDKLPVPGKVSLYFFDLVKKEVVHSFHL